MIEPHLLKTLTSSQISKNNFPPPLWMMRQAGRYLPEYQQLRKKAGNFWTLCFTPDYATEITLQPIRRFQLDAAIIFSDILVIPQALGQKVEFLPNHGPLLEKNNWDSFLTFNNWESFKNHLNPIYTALHQTKKNLPSSCTLIGFSGTPWTLATYMLDLGKEKDPSKKFHESLKALNNPLFIQKLLILLCEAITQHLLYQIKAGADVIQLFDSWAGIVPPSHRSQILYDPLQIIVQNIRKIFPDIPIIYFGKGVNTDYPNLIKIIPHLTLSLDSSTDLQWIKKNLYPHTNIQGNLDPEILVHGGSLLTEKIDLLLETFNEGSYVFNLGHGILPHTPISHVEFLVDRVKSYGK